MRDVEQIHWEEARSALYGFFGQAFLRGPSQQFLEALVSDEGMANLREIFPDAAYREELAKVGLEAREGILTLEEAVLDFEALFRVPGTCYLSPYESVYRAQGAGGRCRLCGPEAAAVERLYLKEGLGPNDGFTELPDHVGVELEFMAYLCGKALDTMRAGDQPLLAEYRRRQQHFFREHVETWVSLLAERLASQAQTSLYRFLGNFLNLFLQLEENLQFRSADIYPVAGVADASLAQGVGQ
ncbi:MAG: molecular chaperone TorD family protein [Desulfobaccales bacterium]